MCIRDSPKTQAPIHLIQVAALQGALCLGPDRENGEPTYVLIDDWIGKRQTPPRESALEELARRYFAAYGPATGEDFVAWSGLPAARARSALGAVTNDLAEVPLHGQRVFILKGRLAHAEDPPPADLSLRLLPAFDTYFLGYRRRDLAVPPALQRRLQRGGGWLHPAVVVDGRVVGAWSLQRSGARGQVSVETRKPLTGALQKALGAEVADIGRFLETKLTFVRGPV